MALDVGSDLDDLEEGAENLQASAMFLEHNAAKVESK